ncbi:MAG: DUF1579 family protein [Thermoleophilia bacterium]|nr:DUF1579 family protein [Thermoleophilia bacterium]
MTERPDIAAVPKPIDVGPEMEALRRFFGDVTWEGTIRAGGMGPGTPTMTGSGRGRHTTIQDGRWIVGDYEQEQYLEDGAFVLKWQLHWVAGWAPEVGEYRASMVDNYGHALVCRGWVDGDRLVFESMDNAQAHLRFTWDASEPGAIVWRNELSTGDGSWFPIEEYRMVPG